MMPLPPPEKDAGKVSQQAEASARELAALQRDFPRFRIWREVIGDRARYVALRRRPERACTPW